MAMAMSFPPFSSLSLFKRCVRCPPESPSCPPCSADETCSLVLADCQQCASAVCIPIAQASISAPAPAPKKSNNIGPIAAAVVGGVLFIVVFSFVLWKFCLNGKRRPILEEDYEFTAEKPAQQSDQLPGVGVRRSARSSTHTVQSMASTVLTRASNVIQIAYIPGITNRQTASPGLLVPPVPPIPTGATSSSSPLSRYRDTANTEEQLFFTAGDIRDSTYSGMTSFSASGDARQSIAPSLARSSVATAIYKATAQVSPLPAPTQTMIRGNAKVVSVSTGGGGGGGGGGGAAHKASSVNSSSTMISSSAAGTPPVPQIDHAAHAHPGMRTIQLQIPASTDALGGPCPSIVKSVTIGAKPVPLNIVKRPPGGQRAGPGRGGSAEPVPPAAAPRGLGIGGLVGAQESIAELVEPVERSVDEGSGSARRGAPLRSYSDGPFGDRNRVSGEVAGGAGEGETERGGSPFADAHAVR